MSEQPKANCRELYVEQKFFYDHLMKMCTTCPKMAHKSGLKAVSTMENFSKCNTGFQFHELDFGLILLCIH